MEAVHPRVLWVNVEAIGQASPPTILSLMAYAYTIPPCALRSA